MDARTGTTGSPRQAEGATRSPRLTLLHRAALALATAALATLGLAAPALADTTIGQTGGDAFTTCGGPAVRADTNYVVPSGGGAITSFSYGSVAGNAGQQLDFLVLRPAGGSDYTVVGKTGLVTLAGTGAVETFAADIDVQGGEILGIWNTGFLASCFRTVASGGGFISSVPFTNPPDPSVGDEISLAGGALSDVDLNESANLVTTPTSPPPNQPPPNQPPPNQPPPNQPPPNQPPPNPPSNEFRLGGVKLNKKLGLAKLTVIVAGPGELELAKTKNVKVGHERAEQSGKVKLSIEPRRMARKLLNKTGKAKVNPKVTYTPDGGASDTKRKKIKLLKR
jgi:hypothetical protein